MPTRRAFALAHFLIQTIGRAARNVNGKVIMYADRITEAMRYAIDETNRRRRLQMEYNERMGITPVPSARAFPTSLSISRKKRWRRRSRNTRRGSRAACRMSSPSSKSWKKRCTGRPRSSILNELPSCGMKSRRSERKWGCQFDR